MEVIEMYHIKIYVIQEDNFKLAKMIKEKYLEYCSFIGSFNMLSCEDFYKTINESDLAYMFYVMNTLKTCMKKLCKSKEFVTCIYAKTAYKMLKKEINMHKDSLSSHYEMFKSRKNIDGKTYDLPFDE